MGSMIHLAVGNLEIDWGKNHGYVDHSALFQPGDLTRVPYHYVDDDGKPLVELKDGLSKPLADVVQRIELLGHTLATCETEFNWLRELNSFEGSSYSFAHLCEALATVDVKSISADYGEGGEDFGKFFRRELYPRLGLEDIIGDPQAAYDISEGMENVSAYTVLRLLAENPVARNLPVTWAFNDLETGGWASREDFVRPPSKPNRFLIVTEGSSDAAILKQALRLLRPQIADFFDFVDMEEGYPFSGTGNVYRFVQGLISIGVLNKIVVVFDNDAEGSYGSRRCTTLNLPANMRVLKLPDHPSFAAFRANGPTGDHLADINGRAAAIECYLDLPAEAWVRWSSFHPHVQAYQGELIGKEVYARDFLKQSNARVQCDYSKLDTLLAALVKTCIAISEPEAIDAMNDIS